MTPESSSTPAPLSSERFRALAESYGADLQRWPEAERAAARSLAAQAGLPELQQVLAEAAELDSWLGSHAVAPPDAALMQRVLAQAPPKAASAAPAAPGAVAAPASPAAPWPRWVWWWPGAGLAGALAGTLAASVLLERMAPAPDGNWPERISAFSELPADWSEP